MAKAGVSYSANPSLKAGVKQVFCVLGLALKHIRTLWRSLLSQVTKLDFRSFMLLKSHNHGWMLTYKRKASPKIEYVNKEPVFF